MRWTILDLADSFYLKDNRLSPLPMDTAIPFGTVLSLPATGSEMNPTAVISYDHAKYFFSSPLVFPKFSVVDPTITFTLPQKQVANGVVDAFIHVTEQYLTFPVDGRVFPWLDLELTPSNKVCRRGEITNNSYLRSGSLCSKFIHHHEL